MRWRSCARVGRCRRSDGACNDADQASGGSPSYARPSSSRTSPRVKGRDSNRDSAARAPAAPSDLTAGDRLTEISTRAELALQSPYWNPRPFTRGEVREPAGASIRWTSTGRLIRASLHAPSDRRQRPHERTSANHRAQLWVAFAVLTPHRGPA